MCGRAVKAASSVNAAESPERRVTLVPTGLVRGVEKRFTAMRSRG